MLSAFYRTRNSITMTGRAWYYVISWVNDRLYTSQSEVADKHVISLIIWHIAVK
jgi:hypothetical protein